ncbi:MAG: hypothetical protein BM564_06975 [Bacteroidetes bacterium MedPE-SWsnd-G2]|nr:MAG: hypothetical protein BM564_06975 [Bacteroidetes bacterium MedPE-SWsnd-G2]
MNSKQLKRNGVLGILFFLPVMFLLLLYPSTHNYQPLDIVKEGVLEFKNFTNANGESVTLKDQITVVGFLGNNPLNHAISASNLKELVYDKFKGFKKFQMVMVLPKGSEAEALKLEREINNYDNMRFWEFAFAEKASINAFYNSLESLRSLHNDMATDYVFVIDKDLNQRGRLDDRTDNEKAIDGQVYGLYSYNSIEVAEIKNKMSEDVRILFTEYRQKREGKFDSTTRRAGDLKQSNEQ